MNLNLSTPVQKALNEGQPLLAMESTILSHGLPYPESLNFVLRANELCQESNVVPATTAIIDGSFHIGLDKSQLDFISHDKSIKKVSRQELGIAAVERWNGATTVSATMHIAHAAGICVLSTGGIGGVHRGAEHSFDISQDLVALKEIPMVVISSGAKAILDLPKTVEVLETYGVCVVGYKTAFFPAFYSRNSGIKIPHRVNTYQEIVKLYRKSKEFSLNQAVLVGNPVPLEHEIPIKEIEPIIIGAMKKSIKAGISGKKTTPFLLDLISRKNGGRGLKTNISLALNNVILGSKIAVNFAEIT